MASSRQNTRGTFPMEKPGVPLPTHSPATNRMWKQDALVSAAGTRLDLDFPANSQTSSAVPTGSGRCLRRAEDPGDPVPTGLQWSLL